MVKIAAGMQIPINKYRFQQPLLFHRAHQKIVEASYVNSLGETVRLPWMDHAFVGYDGKHDANSTTKCGSDNVSLCCVSTWAWKNYGGDWLDADKVPQGTKAWATSPTIPFKAPPGVMEFDVTNFIKYLDSKKTWYAMFFHVTGGNLDIVGPCNTTNEKPYLEIIRNGVTEKHNIWYACSLIKSAYSNAQDDMLTINNESKCAVEFYRDLANQNIPITSAKIVVQYGTVTYRTPSIKIFAVDPPIPDLTLVEKGIAANYTFDYGIINNPNVAAAIRVTDSTTLYDVADREYTGHNYGNLLGKSRVNGKTESVFDPTLWGQPAVADTSNLLPQRLHDTKNSKVIGNYGSSKTLGDTFKVVTSAQIKARGLPVLAPGMGALEFVYPSMRIKPGQTHPQSWTSGGYKADNLGGADLEIPLKREHIGQVVDGYMRMYICLAEGWEPDDAGMAWHPQDVSLERWGKWPEEYGMKPEQLPWRATDFSGKFPGGLQQITTQVSVSEYKYPTRKDKAGVEDTTKIISTPGNGYSATSGVFGYQGRWQFSQGFYKANFEGPACGGAVIGVELYDFGQNSLCLPSQNFIAGWDVQNNAGFQYGLGHLKERKWYCVEMRWKMNTLAEYKEPPIGTHWLESGYVQDGYLEWWVDGIKASKSSVFAHRNSVMVDWALQNSQGRPFGTRNAMRPMNGVPKEGYMGATTAILQTYYGGRSALMKDMNVLINGIVVTNGKYIGPMKGVTRANGGLGTK